MALASTYASASWINITVKYQCNQNLAREANSALDSRLVITKLKALMIKVVMQHSHRKHWERVYRTKVHRRRNHPKFWKVISKQTRVLRRQLRLIGVRAKSRRWEMLLSNAFKSKTHLQWSQWVRPQIVSPPSRITKVTNSNIIIQKFSEVLKPDRNKENHHTNNWHLSERNNNS